MIKAGRKGRTNPQLASGQLRGKLTVEIEAVKYLVKFVHQNRKPVVTATVMDCSLQRWVELLGKAIMVSGQWPLRRELFYPKWQSLVWPPMRGEQAYESGPVYDTPLPME